MSNFDTLCNDELDIIFNFLSLYDIFSTKLLNKKFYFYMNTDFRLENYIYKRANMEIIKKNTIYLEKIIILHDKSGSTDYHFINDDLKDMHNLKILKLRYEKLTDEGLKYISNIQKLNLDWNTIITDEGLKYISNIKKLCFFYNKNITNKGLKYIPYVKKLSLAMKI